MDFVNAHPREFVTHDLNPVMKLQNIIQRHQQNSLKELSQLAEIQDMLPVCESLNLIRSIELCARMWLTINISSENTSLDRIEAHTSSQQWPETLSLSALVDSLFLPTAKSFTTGAFQSNWLLSIAKLVSTSGLKIKWTSNLVDHLNFDRKSKILVLYEHKIWLFNHLEAKVSSPFKPEIIEETIDTLNLLFPQNDGGQNRRFLDKQDMHFHRLGNLGRPRRFYITGYPIWGAKLLKLVEFSKEPVDHWWGALLDRRNLKDWAAFWIAILALALTVIALAFGVVLAVFTIKQYQMAVKQYGLSLAQWCLSSSDLPTALQSYC